MPQSQLGFDNVPQRCVHGFFHGRGTSDEAGLLKQRVVYVDKAFCHEPEYIY